MRCFRVSTHLEDRYMAQKAGKGGRIVAGLGTLLVSIMFTAILVNFLFLIIGFVIFLILAASNKEEGSLTTGIKGENILEKTLSESLSDEYTAFFNIPIESGGDIDCLVIGPTGIYLFEAKNHKGYILCIDDSWSQVKVGKNGKVYDGEYIKDPSSQLRKGIFEVKRVLSRHGINMWIEGVIVFTNPEVSLFCEEPKGIRIIRADEIGSIFKGKKAFLNEKTRGLITEIISENYGMKGGG